MLASESQLYLDLHHLNGLKVAARQRDDAALEEAARQFEAIMLQSVLKSMRESSLGDPLLNGPGARIYRDMFDQQIAQTLAGRNGGVGLARLMIDQLRGGAETSAPAPLTSTPTISAPPSSTPVPLPSRAAPAPAPAADPVAQVPWDGPAEFVAALRPHARHAAERLGIPAEAILAQAALETGWGSKVLRLPDGQPAWNVFGVKAGSSWQGARVSTTTLEFEGGAMRQRQAAFRAYEGLGAAFDDYVRLIETSPRYRDAPGSDSPRAYAEALRRGGYATDPDYADKVARVATSTTIAGVEG